MMMHDADDLRWWQRLITPRYTPLRHAAAGVGTVTPAVMGRLRRDWPSNLVALALELAAARRRARGKFPDADRLVADVPGVEQATSALVAGHKAARYERLGLVGVTDMCCGIGGDAMALGRVADVLGIDLDPVRAWMARCNAACVTRCADVTALDQHDGPFHLDPARRTTGAGGTVRRAWRLADYVPGAAFVGHLVESGRPGAIKLGPGVDLNTLPGPERCEAELISEHGVLVQAVYWTGNLAIHPGRRTATALPAAETFTALPVPLPPTARQAFDRYLYVPDPAIERSRLLGALCRSVNVQVPWLRLGLPTSPSLVDSPWLTAFEVLQTLPWRPVRVRAWLHGHGAGPVEIKTRGGAIDPDRFQGALRGPGETPYTLFVLRTGKRMLALVTRRVNRELESPRDSVPHRIK